MPGFSETVAESHIRGQRFERAEFGIGLRYDFLKHAVIAFQGFSVGTNIIVIRNFQQHASITRGQGGYSDNRPDA